MKEKYKIAARHSVVHCPSLSEVHEVYRTLNNMLIDDVNQKFPNGYKILRCVTGIIDFTDVAIAWEVEGCAKQTEEQKTLLKA